MIRPQNKDKPQFEDESKRKDIKKDEETPNNTDEFKHKDN